MKKTLLITTIAFLIAFRFINPVNAQITFQKKLSGFFSTFFADGQPIEDGGYMLWGNLIIQQGEMPFYLVKLNNNGDTVWTRAFDDGVGANSASCIQQTFDKGYIMAGIQTGSLVHGFNHVIKTDSVGNISWTWTNFSWDGPGVSSISQTLDSGYILSGYIYYGDYSYLTKLDKNGATSWYKVINKPTMHIGARAITSAKQTTDSGYILCGYYNDSSVYGGVYHDDSPYNNVYLVKTNAVGDTLWTKRFTAANGLPDEDAGADIVQTVDGGYLLMGSTSSIDHYSHVFVIKTNVSGDTMWTKRYAPDATRCYGYSINATKDGGYILAGSCDAPNADRHILLIKINSYGDTLWTRNFGTAYETGYVIHPTNDGGYFVVGRWASDSASIYQYSYIVKTDSLGHSGCFEYNTNLVVSSFPVVATSSNTIDSAAWPVDSVHFIVSHYSINDSTVCMSVGIDESVKSYNSISIYPNPATNQLTIHTSSFHNEVVMVSVMNVMGQQASLPTPLRTERGDATIYIGDLPAGMYFLQMKSESGSVVRKFVKE